MNDMALVDTILSGEFKVTSKEMEEISEGMKVAFETRSGCKYLCYKYDELSAGYKGGLFPFFSNSTAEVRSISDYILFTSMGATIYAIAFELKKGKAATMPQFRAAEKFINYIIETAKRIGRKKHINVEIRFVSVREYKLKKGKTMKKEMKYDKNRHFELAHDSFCLNDLIK